MLDCLTPQKLIFSLTNNLKQTAGFAKIILQTLIFDFSENGFSAAFSGALLCSELFGKSAKE
jgi:hypothetical protein